MAISIGPTDFSWLGNLPDAMENARIRSAQRDILQTLDPSSPTSLDQHASRLFAAGDIEGGKLLANESLQRRELQRKVEYDRQYLSSLPGYMAALAGARAGGPGAMPVPTPPEAPAESIYGGGAPASLFPSVAPTPGTGIVPPGPFPSVTPGRSSALPPSLGATDRMSLASLNSNVPQEPTASEQILMAAQGGGASPPPMGPRFAQAGPPTALPAGPTAPPPGAPDMLSTAISTPIGPPPRLPVAPSSVTSLAPETQAYKEALNYIQAAGSVPRNAPGQLAGLRALTSDALARAKVPQERFDWQMSNFDRQSQGQPPQLYSDWQAEQKSQPETYKLALKNYETASETAGKARDLEGTINTMQSLVNNKAFLSGTGTPQFIAGIMSDVRNTKNAILASGIPLPEIVVRAVDSATTPVQFREAFTALASSSVFSKLGGLGVGKSEGDRRFVETAFPSLQTSLEGNQLIVDYYKSFVDQQKGLSAELDKLRSSKGARLAPEDVNRTIQNYVDAHPIAFNADGTPANALGKKLQDAADKAAVSTDLGAVASDALGSARDRISGALGSAREAVTGLGKDVLSAAGAPVSPSYDPNVARREVARAASAAGGYQNPVAALAAGAQAMPGAIRTEFNQMYPPTGPEPTRPPGPGAVNATDVANRLATMAGKEGVPDVGSMISLRQSVPPSQAANVQNAITQRLGSDKGVFDPTLWAENYKNLETKAKVGIFGGAAPGSLRSNYNDITSGNAMDALAKIAPPEAIAKGLSDLAGSSALAAWARAYNVAQRANMTPPARARLRLATDNLMNNLGLGGQ